MRHLASLIFIAMFVPLTAVATDVTFDVVGAVDYDSNVFRRDNQDNGKENIEQDALFRLRPGVEIHEDRGQDVNYSVKYMLPVALSSQYSQLNDIDHLANGEVSYHPTDRVEIYAKDRFRYMRSTLVNRTVGDPGNGIVDSRRDRVTSNIATLGSRYLFTSRLSGKIEANHILFESTRDDRQDNETVTATADTFYTVNTRHKAGLGAKYTNQRFKQSDLVVETKSNAVDVFGQWRWQIDEVTGLDVAAGPSFIRIEQDSTPAGAGQPAVGKKNDKSIKFFGQFGLVRRWTESLTTGMRYTRSQGAASGVGGSVVSDAVVATLDWKFRKRWELTLRGDYVLRESINRVTLRNDASTIDLDRRLKSERWGAAVRLSHLLARKSRIFLQTLYNDQDSKSDSIASSSDFTGWIVTLGFKHTFEPIKLW